MHEDSCYAKGVLTPRPCNEKYKSTVGGNQQFSLILFVEKDPEPICRLKIDIEVVIQIQNGQ